MLRIVGINRHPEPDREFILLQNQGGLKAILRGHAVMAECCIDSEIPLDCMHIFAEDVAVPPGAYVILYTGSGEPKWTKTKDYSMVYYTYLGRDQSVWDRRPGPVHVCAIQHTHTPRPQPTLV